jgi:hypothetical protein
MDTDDTSGAKRVITNISADFDIKIIVGPRDKMLSNMWDDAYKYVTASRVMMCADDVVFRTPDWDKIITKAMLNSEKEIHFCWGNDKNQGKHLATLPIMSSAWISMCGYFVPRGYCRDWCDTHLHDIARKLNKLGYNRMTYVKEVVFEHMHPSIGKAGYDDTYNYRQKLNPGNIFNRRNKERQQIAQKMFKQLKRAGYKTSVCGV